VLSSIAPMSEFPAVPGYRLVSLLGEGGMGRVYLAEDLTLGRRTAIKFVSERMSADPDARARFLREARTMATVEHPHVVRVYSFGEAAGGAYLVMEYVAGESLSERLKRTKRLDATEAIKLTRQVAEALDAAWEQHLVHRDIKPSNILLDTKGQVRVADFGLAKPLGVRTTDESLTQAGSILGTPHYVSPEQARGRSVDIRSDIYSLGIVLYEMLAGERPFEGKTPFDVVAQHLHEPLPSLDARRPDLPAGVVALVNWMTEKDPERRPQSYAALRERLRTLGEAGASTPIPTSTLNAAGVRRGSLVRAQWALLAGLLLVAAGLGSRAYRYRIAVPAPADVRLVVAVTPFSGPDEDSAKEGKVMARLIEKAIDERLRRDDVRVIGADQTREPVRDHAAARALGERLGANAVIWGEAFALRGETEIQPYLTLVPRRAAEKETSPNLNLPGRDPLAALAERAGSSLVMGAQAPNQIELRKTGAAGVSDLVLTLAGSHALAEGQAEKALTLFTQAPRTAENLRRRADALLMLNRTEEARLALSEAVTLAPDDPQSHASLGDVLLTTGHFPEAVAAYTKAATGAGPYRSREAILYEGKLYRRETSGASTGGGGETRPWDTLYMLGLDPRTGHVLERHPLPGSITGLSPSESGIEVSYRADESREFGEPFEAAIGFTRGSFKRPVFPPPSLLLRRHLATSGSELGSNFLSETGFRPRGGGYALAPQDFASLEETLRQAQAIDPTQPWYLFLQGQAAWAQGRRDEAEAKWRELFATAFAGIPYGPYTRMAMYFERYGQPAWADRAYEEALKRRKTRPPFMHDMFLIGRLISFPVVSGAARALGLGGDPQRGHLWLARAREFGGFTEGDEIAAAIWEAYFRERGNAAEADVEADVWRRVTADPVNPDHYGPRLDSAITLFLGLTLAAWLALGALMVGGRQRARARGSDNVPVRAALAEISGYERRVVMLACFLGVAAYAPVAFQANRVVAGGVGPWNFPVGLPDSLGNAAAVRWADKLAGGSSNKRTAQFLAGVAHHLAGDVEGARGFYNGIAGDPRAQRNLAALAQGQLTPPSPATATDVIEALTGKMTFAERLSPGSTSLILASFDLVLGLDLITLALLLTLLLGVTFGLLQWRSPGRGVPSLVERPSGWHKVVPGVLDLLGGAPVRGQVALSLASVSLVAVSIAVYTVYTARFAAASGIVAAQLTVSLGRAFPVPAYSFWTVFWARPGAIAYWSCIGAAALVAIVLQVLGIRRAQDRIRILEPQTDLTLSRQDTRAPR